MTKPALVCNDITPLAQYQRGRLGQLPDQDLLASTRRLVGASNQILAELLAHLAEVEARGVHRLRLCTSLYAYCVYELQFSEDAAFRRVSAARLLHKFPVLYDAIASGELHLTGVLQVGPHLTPENLSEVLARSKHRTKKEIAKLVRELDPLPDVPARIEPLGPGPVLPQPIKMRNPTWSEYMLMLNPVNHLPPGQRPGDWMGDTPFALVPQSSEESAKDEVPSIKGPAIGAEHIGDGFGGNGYVGDGLVRDGLVGDGFGDNGLVGAGFGGNGLVGDGLVGNGLVGDGFGGNGLVGDGFGDNGLVGDGFGDNGLVGDGLVGDGLVGDGLVGDGLVGNGLVGDRLLGNRLLVGSGEQDVATKQAVAVRDAVIVAPQRFAVQFTATDEYVALVERAQALLSQGPKVALEELHLRAIKALVAELERNKFATTKRRSAPLIPARPPTNQIGEEAAATESERVVESSQSAEPGRAKAATLSGSDDAKGARLPRRRGRAIPAAVRRAVYERDGLRCTHVDESGARCAETHRLQFHHAWAFGRGGEHSVANVTLRCVTHNDLAAEVDFGAEKMRAAKDRQRHEPLIRHKLPR